MTLAWAGPATGAGKPTESLGKIGKGTLNGALPAAPSSKSRNANPNVCSLTSLTFTATFPLSPDQPWAIMGQERGVKHTMQKQLTLVKALIALTAPALLLNCGANPNIASVDKDPVQLEEANGAVKSTVILGKVGALSKSATINLSRLVLEAVSSATPADTVRDTASVSGNDAVTVLRTLTLKPLRNWTVSAKSLDAKDSVVHTGTSAAFFVKPADTSAVSLNLTSRFAMYQANFNTLPDSIASSASGTGKDKLNLKRMVLKVDGVILSDSLLLSGYFAGGANVSLYFDYITPGSHTVTLEAYGALHTYSGILYSGSSTFSVTAGNDDTRAVTLNWVGPTTGTGKLTVTLGKVGIVIVNGTLPSGVIN